MKHEKPSLAAQELGQTPEMEFRGRIAWEHELGRVRVEYAQRNGGSHPKDPYVEAINRVRTDNRIALHAALGILPKTFEYRPLIYIQPKKK